MRPQQASKIPDVLDGWLGLLGEARDADDGPLKGVQVIDGPVRKLADVQAEAVGVGMGDQNFPGATSLLEQMPGMGARAYAERIEVTMMIGVSGGSSEMTSQRTRAGELLAGVKAIVDANQIRSGVWDQAFMGDAIEWYPSNNEVGISVEAAFTVVTRSIV